MKLKTRNGYIFWIDSEDYGGIKGYTWRGRHYRYKRVNGEIGSSIDRIVAGDHSGRGGKTILIHRLIMDAPEGVDVDHINGNGLDNRKKNLRLCTRSQNLANANRKSNNKSGIKGVSWSTSHKKWQAQIMINWKPIHLGYFDSKIEAALIYNKMANKLHSNFAKLSEIGFLQKLKAA